MGVEVNACNPMAQDAEAELGVAGQVTCTENPGLHTVPRPHSPREQGGDAGTLSPSNVCIHITGNPCKTK